MHISKKPFLSRKVFLFLAEEDLNVITWNKLGISYALTNATRTFENYICVASFCKKTVLLQVQRKEIESHLQEAVRPHVDLAFAKLTSTQEELKKSQDLTSELNEKFKDLERQVKLFVAKFNDQQLIIRRLSSNGHGERVNALERKVEKVNALERKVGTFQTQLEKRAVELEDRVETVEMILKDDSKKVDSLEKSFQLLKGPLNPMRMIEQKENTSMSKDFALPPKEEICFEINPGMWINDWKIQGFIGFLNRAEKNNKYEIWSNPFFLGEKGYKFKLGLGISDSFLKIKFVIMKSENDVILPWPFFKRIVYIVVDQEKSSLESENRTILDADVSDNLVKKSFERPILEENPPWEYPCVLGLSELSERCYILNDTVIIRVVIGPRC